MAAFRPAEQGFVLIGAIWLLILCGAVAALLLLRSLHSAAEAGGEAEALRRQLALEGAAETALADMLFNGPRSRWAMLPASAVVRIGTEDIAVRVESEAGRLDINEAPLSGIEAVLAGSGWTARERAAVLAELARRRRAGEPIPSLDAERALIAARPGSAMSCTERHFTLWSGRREPDPAGLSPELARLLGRPVPTGSAAPPSAGAPLRIVAQGPRGAPLNAVVRIGGLLDRPLDIMAWERRRECG